jgi:hypothetical protein
MKHTIVTYETALLLKEIGYPQNPYKETDNYSKAYYPSYTDGSGAKYLNNPLFSPKHIIAIAPLLGIANKWLREEKNIYIEMQVDKTSTPKFTFEINEYNPDIIEWFNIPITNWSLYRTYYEAMEEAIKISCEYLKGNNEQQ